MTEYTPCSDGCSLQGFSADLLANLEKDFRSLIGAVPPGLWSKICSTVKKLYLSHLVCFCTHTHTHTHTYIYAVSEPCHGKYTKSVFQAKILNRTLYYMVTHRYLTNPGHPTFSPPPISSRLPLRPFPLSFPISPFPEVSSLEFCSCLAVTIFLDSWDTVLRRWLQTSHRPHI